mgnify:CR=1 FL=1|jgi:hypothetical protein
MSMKTSLIVTSIFEPTDAMRELADGVKESQWDFIVMGDNKSPSTFDLDGARFVGMKAQRELSFQLAAILPENHYCRKNLGYLLAIEAGSKVLVETDDDNFPLESFWQTRSKTLAARNPDNDGWINVYRHFSETDVWPRGFPLEAVKHEKAELGRLVEGEWPVQQGLADQNPDVDAVFRLTRKLPVSFHSSDPVSIQIGQWCPFNSQNTTWFEEAFPLLYLPAHCSFRMTDIWRSFVAQRLLWTLDSGVVFHDATVLQVRNDHDLHKDFSDEMEGYLSNPLIAFALSELTLTPGREHLAENLLQCYNCLIDLKLVGPEERPLVEAWIADMRQLGCLS